MTPITISLSAKADLDAIAKEWTAFCKEEKLHKAVCDAGLQYIKDSRFHPYSRIAESTMGQIWNIASERARGKF